MEEVDRLARREPLEVGDADLDHEAAAGLEVRGRVAEARDLRLLRRQVHDRVVDEIDERERPVHPRRREVADRHADVVAARLRAQPRDHRLREVDPVHRHAALRQREGDPARPDRRTRARVRRRRARPGNRRPDRRRAGRTPPPSRRRTSRRRGSSKYPSSCTSRNLSLREDRSRALRCYTPPTVSRPYRSMSACRCRAAAAGSSPPRSARRGTPPARASRPRTRGRRGPSRTAPSSCRGRWRRRARPPPGASARSPGDRRASGPPRRCGTARRSSVRPWRSPASGPIVNSARSWSFVESGACRNFAVPGNSPTTRKPSTSR